MRSLEIRQGRAHRQLRATAVPRPRLVTHRSSKTTIVSSRAPVNPFTCGVDIDLTIQPCRPK